MEVILMDKMLIYGMHFGFYKTQDFSFIEMSLFYWQVE